MKRKSPGERIKALARLGNVFTVVATSELKVPDEEVGTFGCGDCGTKFATQARLEPFCVVCGSDEVTPKADSEHETLEDSDDEELSAVSCPKCKEHNIMSTATASALNGSASCVVCGSDLNFVTPEADSEGETDPLREDEDADEVTATEEDGDGLGGDIPGDESVNTLAPSAGDDPAVFNLIDTVDPTDDEDELAMLLNDGVLVASINSISVAKLTKADAGVNSDVYTKESFAHAVGHTAERIGIKAALAHYNFKLIQARFPLQNLVDSKVEAAVAQKNKEVTATIKDLGADYAQCLSIASLGLSKNFFKGKDNALKSGFTEELANAGVRNPGAVVERVFSHYGQPFIKTLLETAEELMSKSLDVRNQLAETLDAVNPVAENSPEDLDDDDDAGVEARFAGASLRPIAKANRVEAATIITSIREARTLAGGRLF